MYAIIVSGRIVQLSEQPLEVAAPIECVPVPTGENICENWSYSVNNGQPIFTAPPESKLTTPSLKYLAQSALNYVMNQALSLTVMGEVFGPNARACVQKLRAIANGTDTTSTELPAVPSDLTT